MGTVLEITLVGRDPEELRGALVELFAEARRLEALLTVFDPESELSRLNRAAGRGPLAVDPELARVLDLSLRYARLTRGSFDVTVGPLVQLWTEAAARDSSPGAAALAEARARVGAEHLRVLADGTAELTRTGVSVNLGGMAKGYALDRMRPLLARRGVGNALLNFGQSSTWALGSPEDAEGWRLLARGPGGDFLGVLTLRDQALSVSGSLGQWVEIGGRRYGHVLDPRSGEPLTRRRQALVVAPEAALAEALSKALLVLGEAEGLALVAEQAGCEALLVDADGGTWRTPGWAAAVRFEAAR
jgi:thiamine biosynthesis lipoprotein